MKLGTVRAGWLATIIALIGIFVGVSTVAEAHASAGHGVIHAEHYQSAISMADAAVDCTNQFESKSHSACCAASPFGCCAASLLVPPEPVADAPVGAPMFALTSLEAPSGLPPGTLRKPPRLTP